ncbi:calcium-binding and coiled-coil domain-containing protein 2 [Rana temporaria]|uniref:calcium-binding and coiled-coil domain-containing protein 2 n=1 Tax=Rana temporaria TaxID=8407 RepID=UPI001AAD4CD1|nr:calcium-binding and coiled-coil domain-containing protein 2 [Rana temporaria]
MEAEGAEMQDTVQRDSGQEGPPTSLNPMSFENFSQVVFPNILQSYRPKTDILCSFHQRKDFLSGSKDWIGIFKVGWQTTKEYYTWVALSTSMDNQVLFKAYYLPKDDEYYQFCYVDQNGDVRGVSNPFQFREDDAENEIENEIVMVATVEEMENMNEENKNLKKIIQDQAEMIKTQEAQLQTATEKDNRIEEENMGMLCQVKNLEEEKEALIRNNQESELQLYKVHELETELEQKDMELKKLKAENKQLQDLQIKVKNLEEENESWLRKNQELELLLKKVQDSENKLKQKMMDLEKIEAENKQLRSKNEAKQEAVENLSALSDNCKKEVTKLTTKLEKVQTSTLESEKRQKEEFQRSLKEEKGKLLDLESNLTKTSTMLKTAEDNVSKLQQQLALQQKEFATKNEEIKKLHLDITHLQANEVKLKDNIEEHMRIITNEKKAKADLEQMLNRQDKKVLDFDNKIRELKTDLRSAQESKTSMERKLAKEQDEIRKNKEHILVLQSTIELREVEIRDLNDITARKQAEVEDLNMKIFQERFAYSPPFSSTSQTQGLMYRNPYSKNRQGFSAENESLERVDFGTRLQQEKIQTPTKLKCSQCSEEFQDEQVYVDHAMCHSIEEGLED